MKKYMFILAVSVCLLIIPTLLSAGGKSFVDFDGDGFNDNITDIDNNGIPDEFQSHVKEVASTGQFSFSPDALFGGDNQTSGLKLSVSQEFSLHRFKARQLARCRCDFESGFNTGLNVNASSGGGCVGGVCF